MRHDVMTLLNTGGVIPRITTEDELIAIHFQLVTGGQEGKPGWLAAAQKVDRLLFSYGKSTTEAQFDVVDRVWFALVDALRQPPPRSLREEAEQFGVVDGFLAHLAALIRRAEALQRAS